MVTGIGLGICVDIHVVIIFSCCIKTFETDIALELLLIIWHVNIQHVSS